MARCTRARVLDVTRNPDLITPEDRPDYYSLSDCTFFFRLTDFEEMPPGWASDNLARMEAPTVPHGGLQSQSGLLYVVHRVGADVASRGLVHTWWVNQGTSYAAESSGGFVWAPVATQAGYSVAHHTNVSMLRPGHVIVHYANTAIRAIGQVSGWPCQRQSSSRWPTECRMMRPTPSVSAGRQDPTLPSSAANGWIGHLWSRPERELLCVRMR
jgi:hypothetical protein